ncbi:hypothetical protein JW926_06870 [Candidatus Sumerlaeota bacterium]|nr:hypothetical protein [Candidatus Sumerlaeota bacterium]
MNASGWIFMIASWLFIISLCVFCFRKIFFTREQNIVYPLEIEEKLERKDSEKL